MSEHPIQGLMQTAMQSIKDMVDVNTIVGNAVEAADGTVIIPISTVSFGFAAGGGEYGLSSNLGSDNYNKEISSEKHPFAGGSGAGVNISPVAFMVVGQNQIKLMPVNINSTVDKMLDLVPDIIDKANDAIKKKVPLKKETVVVQSSPKYIKVED